MCIFLADSDVWWYGQGKVVVVVVVVVDIIVVVVIVDVIVLILVVIVVVVDVIVVVVVIVVIVVDVIVVIVVVVVDVVDVVLVVDVIVVVVGGILTTRKTCLRRATVLRYQCVSCSRASVSQRTRCSDRIMMKRWNTIRNSRFWSVCASSRRSSMRSTAWYNIIKKTCTKNESKIHER